MATLILLYKEQVENFMTIGFPPIFLLVKISQKDFHSFVKFAQKFSFFFYYQSKCSSQRSIEKCLVKNRFLRSPCRIVLLPRISKKKIPTVCIKFAQNFSFSTIKKLLSAYTLFSINGILLLVPLRFV